MEAATDMYGRKWQGRNDKNQTRMEKEVNGKALLEDGAEVQSPERKCIRAESEGTQHHVRESLNLGREEAEETSFVPSSLSIPRRPMCWCDNRCSDKALKFWQFASLVVDDGEEAPHDQFVSAVLQRKIDGTGPGAVNDVAVEGSCGKEGTSWQIVENAGERTSTYKECGSTS